MTPISGACEWLEDREREGSQIILITARPEHMRSELVAWLSYNGLVYHQLVMGVAGGDRVLVNDAHPEGKYTTRALVIPRNGRLQ